MATLAAPAPTYAPLPPSRAQLATWLGLLALGFLWSGWAPKDRLTWWLEVFPAIIGVVVLAATYRRFPFTALLYWLMLSHMWILLIGGRYTYAEVPLGFWVQDLLHLSRNHFDRLGHFAQGLVPALISRELLLRRGVLRRRGWLVFLVTCICLAISALYELLEMVVSRTSGDKADAFLGTQGDVWDTQMDMTTALAGALVGQLLLARWHDRQLRPQ